MTPSRMAHETRLSTSKFKDSLPMSPDLMMVDYCHPKIRMRPLHWRWKRAQLSLEYGLRLRRIDDDWTRRARLVQRALQAHDGNPYHPKVIKTDPLVMAAYRLNHGNERLRTEIEARLLSGQDSAGISARTGIAADVVVAFEALFYSVRDRLECYDWVAGFCFGLKAYQGLTREDFGLIWKIIAYCMGPNVLDDILDSEFGGSASGIRTEGSGPHTAAAEDVRALINVMTLPMGPGSERRVIELAIRLEQIERENTDRVAGPLSARLVVGDRIVDSIAAAVVATERKVDDRASAGPWTDGARSDERSDEGGDFGKPARRTG
jgi:hypothetical protein